MIKQRLTEEINKLEDYIFVDLLDFEEFVFAMSSPIESEKIDRIMTTVLRKGNSACEKLIQILRENNILKWAEMKGKTDLIKVNQCAYCKGRCCEGCPI